MTFMIRPSVSGPTGMVIGLPLSRTRLPLTRPSVPSMAIVRTVFSPGNGKYHIVLRDASFQYKSLMY